MNEQIAQAAALFVSHQPAVALTGAGISVPSGIPDFRSPGSGLWERDNPMEVASIEGFRADPSRFFNWLRPLIHTTLAAQPNPAHVALAQLQAMGRLGHIITQNIDGLHEAAGSRDVLPVHGHTRTATCQGCQRQVPGEAILPVIMAGEVPTCERCGGVLKPDMIFFGELLPEDIFLEAEIVTSDARLVIAVGTSLEVSPVSKLPWYSMYTGGRLLIVNLGPTALDQAATLKIEGDAAEVLPAIVAALEHL